MTSKHIFILIIMALLLTGCTLNLKKVIPQTNKATQETTTESTQNTATMSLTDVQKELNSMDDLNVDQDLGAIDKEL